MDTDPPRFKVNIKKWHAVAEWKWDVKNEEKDCSICRFPFNGCAPEVKYPGDDCPPGIALPSL